MEIPDQNLIEPLTTPWDPAERLLSKDDIATYLSVALEDELEPDVLLTILDQIVRSKGMTEIARDTGMTAEEFKELFTPGKNLDLTKFLKTLHALGLHLRPFATQADAV